MALAASSRPRANVCRDAHYPATMGGLNTLSGGSATDPLDAVKMVNLIAAEQGLRSRLGSREWCVGLTGALDNSVRSILPFAGSTADNDKLFAATSAGIWDVTAFNAPVLDLDFASPTGLGPMFGFMTTGDAGRMVSTVMVNAAGHHLLAWDEVNGFLIRSESTGTWAQGNVSGVSALNLVFGTVWKHRVWHVERDTAKAWYGAIDAISGAHTSFNFGNNFRAGGSLVGLWSWTGDGGIGIDDHLVAISSGGDVVIYKGTDPASDFAIVGVWELGSVPSGRGFVTQFGGDLLMLCSKGIVPVSQLPSGNPDSSIYPSAKVANLINTLVTSRRAFKGWALQLHPEDNALMVMVPTAADAQPTEQLAMALAAKGWGRYEDLPIYSSGVWDGKLYFGTADGKVCVNDGYVDGVTVANSGATAVEWKLLTSFQGLGTTRQKQARTAVVHMLSESTRPAVACEARYDFNQADISTAPTAGTDGNAWDSGTWDSATFSDEYTASQTQFGLTGIGRKVALALRGSAVSRTILVGVDVTYEVGGY